MEREFLAGFFLEFLMGFLFSGWSFYVDYWKISRNLILFLYSAWKLFSGVSFYENGLELVSRVCLNENPLKLLLNCFFANKPTIRK